MAAKIGTTIWVSGPGMINVCLNINCAIFRHLIEGVFDAQNQRGAQQLFKTNNPSVGQLADYYFNTGQFQSFLDRYPPSFSVVNQTDIQKTPEAQKVQ